MSESRERPERIFLQIIDPGDVGSWTWHLAPVDEDDVTENVEYVLAPTSQGEPDREPPSERGWREAAMWSEWLADIPPKTDRERRQDPRHAAVERWVYRLVSVGNCLGTIPTTDAILRDLDALAPQSDAEREDGRVLGMCDRAPTAEVLKALDDAAWRHR